MANTKQEWLDYFNQKYGTNSTFTKKVNGKKHKFSYFHTYATEEFKNDKELVAYNFNKHGFIHEVEESMIDFEFIKKVFNIKESTKCFLLPYEWKNNPEEKKFLKHILEVLGVRQTDFRSNEIMWTFELGFWSNINYNKTIKNYDYDYLNLAMIKELNNSDNQTEKNYLLEVIANNPYYLKYIKAKNKSLLPLDTLLAYARDYGLTSLTKEQKNRYEVVKEAFQNQKINYDNLDNKWKTKEILVDLLNHRNVWRSIGDDGYIMTLENLSPELLEDKDIMKSCMSDGYNIIELKSQGSHWFEDKELKKLALRNHANYRIIEDCFNDVDLVLDFMKILKREDIYTGINLFEQTKRIEKDIFENFNVMKTYVSIKNLNEKAFFVKGAIEALNSDKFSLEEMIELIKTNKEVYKLLKEELKEKWELILPFFEKNKWTDSEMLSDQRNLIDKVSMNFEERLNLVKKYELEERLNRTLGDKEKVKKLKI